MGPALTVAQSVRGLDANSTRTSGRTEERMCGIMGYIGGRQAAPIVLDGLSRLEYRGYDSAGLAILRPTALFATYKAVGKLTALHAELEGGLPSGKLGLGHTRWATHGPPNLANAHPHLDCSGRIAVVQNGIVENYAALKHELAARGHEFTSQTDTEVIPHLIEEGIDAGLDLEESVRRMLTLARGALALLVAGEAEPEKIVAVRNGAAGGLVIGVGNGEAFVASDLPALVPLTSRVVFLDAGEVAVLSADGIRITTSDGAPVERSATDVVQNPMVAAKGKFRHFMHKEIMDQPEALTDVIRGRVDLEAPALRLEELDGIVDRLRTVRRVILTGCGTSHHAALVGRHYFESVARIPVEVEIASELRYRDIVAGPDDLVVSITQSGETADTLGAMERLRHLTELQIAITNVPGSQASRIAAATIEMRAGLEMGVAATKTFTSSIVCLYLLALYIGDLRRTVGADDLARRLQDLARLPGFVDTVLQDDGPIDRLAEQFVRSNHFLYLGRGWSFPLALEGALKLKEISYLHAEGYAAGEMKHGPIALIDAEMPTFVLAPAGTMNGQMVTGIEEIKARNGIVIGLVTEGDEALAQRVDHAISVPAVPEPLLPIVTAIPLQLFAYRMGLHRGADVDQPRNLAKSVTVE